MLRAFRRNRLALVGAALVVVMMVAAAAAPLLAPFDPIAQSVATCFQSPSASHLLGSGFFGCDVLSRVSAAEALGAPRRRILLCHVLPNVLGELLVMGSLWMGTAIRLEANLSFLGLGVAPPTPTWGNMIRTGLDYLTSAWWVAVFPGLAILITVLAFNLLGDGIRDVADPHLTT